MGKADELRSLLSAKECISPLSHYVVVKRVTSESNFLKTYLGLIEFVNLPTFDK